MLAGPGILGHVAAVISDMATDYDAPRKNEEDQSEESLEELKARRHDKNSGKVDEDEAEAAESFELPGADLSHEELAVEVKPKQEDEFTCMIRGVETLTSTPRPR